MNPQRSLPLECEVKKNTEKRKRPKSRSSGSSEVQRSIQLDEHGMVLPHSILGSLDDFRSYLETKGDTELVQRIPKSQKEPQSKAVKSGGGVPPFHRHEKNALQNWQTHMRHRRQQQEHLSDVLNKPLGALLVNQANHFRDIQEQREYIYQVKPLTQTGSSHCAGSEFWKLPQKYGDEISGISATLTRREKGRLRPITRIGQPASICAETGTTESLRPASRSWQHSLYLRQQYQKLEQYFQKTKRPVFSGLEVIGKSGCSSLTRGSPSTTETEEDEFEQEDDESEDEPQSDESQPFLPIPALRFFGHPSCWTGNTAAYKEEVGISVTLIFEALTGKIAMSTLEMHNVGATCIFYSWQQLPLTRRFTSLHSRTNNVYFYFDSSPRFILPAEKQNLEFMFKAEHPGIKTEVWQLITHPLQLQGASIKVILKGTSLYQDTSADQRLFIDAKLENKVKIEICQAVVNEIVRGIRTPDRPCSPTNLFKTEEQLFLEKNPKFYYLCREVDALAELWRQTNPDHTWDLSIDTLERVLLALPKQPPNLDSKENILTKFNSLLFNISEPIQIKPWHLSATTQVQQLWIAFLDNMADEATWLRNLLGLPEPDTWAKDESYYCDIDLLVDTNEDARCDKKEMRRRLLREKKRKREEAAKRAKEKLLKESQTDPESITQQSIDEQIAAKAEAKALAAYSRILPIRVFALMENLVESLCNLLDEEDDGDIFGVRRP